jgi:hypothetical protein
MKIFMAELNLREFESAYESDGARNPFFSVCGHGLTEKTVHEGKWLPS